MSLKESPQTEISTQPQTGRRRVRRRHSHSPLHRIRRRFFRLRHLRTLVISVVVILIVLVVGELVLVTDSTNELNGSYTNLTRMLNTLSKRPGSELTLADFDRLQSSIDEVARSIAVVKQRTALVRPLASFNSNWDIQLRQLDISDELVTAAQEMLAGFQPTLFFLVNGTQDETVVTQISSGARIVELLQVGRGSFINASQHLDAANATYNSIPLDEMTPDLLLQFETLDQMYQQLHDINQLLIDAPDLLTFVLGLDTTRSYLILAANSDEIRPSGGYLSTYGWMTVRNGRIVDYDYSPTTSASPAPPPASMASEVQVPDWWIQYSNPIYAAWDGSWSPDFPSTARMAMWFYNNGGNLYAPVDGVLSIDLYGFEYILKALGEVHVPDYGTTVTVDNFREVVYDIRAYGQGVVPHKRFVASVYRQIFSDWQTLSKDMEANGALLGAVLQALREHHIMMYVDNDRINEALNLLNWSGKQQPATGHDYLMVADANLGNKSNSSIIRQLTYDVTIQDDGTLTSSATVDYDYSDAVAKNDPAVNPEFHGPLDYNDLLQVFIPVGSTLSDTNLESPPRVVADADHTNLISLVQVPYNTSERFQFQYTTPALIDTIGQYQRYRLLVEQQPGEPVERLNVQVRLPSDAQVVSTTPTPAQSYNLDSLLLDFRIDLVSDQWIEVIYTRNQ